jgi:hypothetical protein
MTEWNDRRLWMLLAAAVTIVGVAGVHGQSQAPASPIPSPPSASKPAVTAALETFTAPSWLRKALIEARPGSCRVTVTTPAVSSWPSRGEPAITFCRK